MARHSISIEEMVGGYLVKSHNSYDKDGTFSMVVTDEKIAVECLNTFLKEKYLIKTK